jgi:hypothetical protein
MPFSALGACPSARILLEKTKRRDSNGGMSKTFRLWDALSGLAAAVVDPGYGAFRAHGPLCSRHGSHGLEPVADHGCLRREARLSAHGA